MIDKKNYITTKSKLKETTLIETRVGRISARLTIQRT